MRKHGFEHPRNAMQIATWVLLPGLLFQFVLCVSPVLPVGASIPLSIVFGLFAAASTYYGYQCCMVDPVDDRLRRHLGKIAEEHRQSMSLNPHMYSDSSLDASNKNINDSARSMGEKREASPFSRAELSDTNSELAASEAAAGDAGGNKNKKDATGGAVDSSGHTLSRGHRRSNSAGPSSKVGMATILFGKKRHRRTVSEGDLSSVCSGPHPAPGEGETEESITKFCWVCQTRVHVKSMHCKFCDKCVGDFDHHCQWLNTCVGRNNYGHFFNTVCSLTGFLGTHAACSAYVAASYFVQKARGYNCTDCTLGRMSTVYGGGADVVLVWIIVAFLAGVLMFLGLIVQLLFFHLGLQRKHISTYEYIIRDNAKKREKAKLKQELKLKRNRTISDRKRKGQTTIWYTVGEYCPPCDPMREEERRLHHSTQGLVNGGTLNGSGSNVGFAVPAGSPGVSGSDNEPQGDGEGRADDQDENRREADLPRPGGGTPATEAEVAPSPLQQIPSSGDHVEMTPMNGNGIGTHCVAAEALTNGQGEGDGTTGEGQKTQPQHDIQFISVSKDSSVASYKAKTASSTERWGTDGDRDPDLDGHPGGASLINRPDIEEGRIEVGRGSLEESEGSKGKVLAIGTFDVTADSSALQR